MRASKGRGRAQGNRAQGGRAQGGRARAVCYALGALLILAALGLTAYNLRTDADAGKAAGAALEALAGEQGGAADKASDPSGADADGNDAALVPDYALAPDKDMPTVEVDGWAYVGTLAIPSLGLELPVKADWSYDGLLTSPCRYTGSAYRGDLVVLAHNYTSHFGTLKYLSPGDDVYFTDVDGNVFYYRVAEVETLDPYAVDEMTNSGWDLTLFTCTLGGQSRVTVRCEQVSVTPAGATGAASAEGAASTEGATGASGEGAW